SAYGSTARHAEMRKSVPNKMASFLLVDGVCSQDILTLAPVFFIECSECCFCDVDYVRHDNAPSTPGTRLIMAKAKTKQPTELTGMYEVLAQWKELIRAGGPARDHHKRSKTLIKRNLTSPKSYHSPR